MMRQRHHAQPRFAKESSMSSVPSDEALYDLVVRAGETKALAAGEVVFQPGERGDRWFIFGSGAVAVSADAELVEIPARTSDG
jgi:hypothetical protein